MKNKSFQGLPQDTVRRIPLFNDTLFPCNQNKNKFKEECTMKTALGILKLTGKASARFIIWLAGKLEGGK